VASGDGLGLFFNINQIPCGPPAAPPPEVGPTTQPTVRGFNHTVAPNNTTTSVTIFVPTHVEGDLLVWIIGDTASAGVMSATPPAGWTAPPGGIGTGGGGASLRVFTRIASSEPSTYTVNGTLYPTTIMYSLQHAAATTTPDAIAFANSASSSFLNTPALSGLSVFRHLVLGIYIWGATFDLAPATEIGSLANDISEAGYPGQFVGMWSGHMLIATTSVAAQAATYPSAVNWRSVAVAISAG
jgi:hypothetical protein